MIKQKNDSIINASQKITKQIILQVIIYHKRHLKLMKEKFQKILEAF